MRLKKSIGKILVVLLIGVVSYGLAECADTSDSRLDNAKIENAQIINHIEFEEGNAFIREDSGKDNREAKDIQIQYPLLVTPKSTKNIEFAIESEDIFCIYNGEKYGYIKMDSQEITEYIYDMGYPFSEGTACVVLDGKYGFIGDNGEIILPHIYDDAAPFSEGLAYYAKDGEYGFMKKDGTVAFQFECDSVSSFKEGLAYFSLDGKYGYIDQKGQIVIEAVYDDADYFKNGLARVVVDGYAGLISQTGEEIVPFIYDYINFEKEYIIAGTGDEKIRYSLEGEKIIDDDLKSVENDNSLEGTSAKEYEVIYENGKYGIICGNGDIHVPIEYNSARIFEDGSISLKKDDVTELYNEDGELVLRGNYDYITPHNGKYYELEKDNRISFVDIEGEELFSVECDYNAHYIYGDYRNYVLRQYSSDKKEQLLILEDNNDIDLSEVILKNSITPRIKLYWELTHGKHVMNRTTQDGSIIETRRFSSWEEWSYIKKFRLYDINERRKPILYTYEEPCVNMSFPMSDSSFWDIRDDQLHEIITGYECGGSMRGDYVCLWRDNEKGDVLIGTWGAAGGFGGYAYYSYIYQYEAGKAESIAYYDYISQNINNYNDEELENTPELFYDMQGIPCTKDNIYENEYLDAYYFNDELVTVEEYMRESERYTKLYIP